ncbi:hypothetical protein [uncultured Roseivirga sp.]|uniref:hypothetical protein n=1 Tax=uncultured Roseivirga sp. TaxID=543088 RepID=UPI0030DD1FE3|tara:strand:+ start:5477 stop:6307 length:831 start_codon:yes stop_codon:yes gene_type:complete
MGIFGRRDRQHYFLELYKIADQQSASEFDTQGLILRAVELLGNLTGLKANSFNLNYSDKSYKTVKGFKSRFQKYSEVVHCFVAFDSKNTHTCFTVSNPILNYLKNEKRPNNSAIDISFQVDADLVEISEIQLLAEKLIKNFSFEYGYLHKFPTNKFHGEKRVKKGFFSTSVSVGEMDYLWKNHQIGILHGYLKKLYFINYINKSHIINPEISKLLNSYGETEQISDDILKWILRDDEFQTLIALANLRNSCIVTEDLRFLDNSISDQLKAQMIIDE